MNDTGGFQHQLSVAPAPGGRRRAAAVDRTRFPRAVPALVAPTWPQHRAGAAAMLILFDNMERLSEQRWLPDIATT